ncbi:MAG: hypothetical protein QM743_07485 [Chitinophagaceae bacterium]
MIAAQRIGQTVIAVDSYAGAPAMQVAHGFEVINMLDGTALDSIVARACRNSLFRRLKKYVPSAFRL